MPNVLDVFNQDAFGFDSMSASVDKVPYKPKMLGEMNIFDEKNPNAGIRTKTAMIEERHGKLTLLKTQARGTRNQYENRRNKKTRSFPVPYIPGDDTITADDLIGLRGFGTNELITEVSSEVNDKLENLKADHEATWEHMRVGAVKGDVKDADGTTSIYNWYTEFGITQKVVTISVASDTIKTKFHEVTRHIEDKLGGDSYTSIFGICGKTFMDRFSTATETKDAYERFQEGKVLFEGQARKVFQYSDLNIREYRGSIGGTAFVEDNAAYCFPLGTRNVFKRFNAPGTFIESVGKKGKAIYAKKKMLDYDMGVEIHTQSSPLFICLRPAVVVKIVLNA